MKELRKKTASELSKLLGEEREHLRVLRFKRAGGELKNVRDIAKTRQTIARVLTLSKEEKKHVKTVQKGLPSGAIRGGKTS